MLVGRISHRPSMSLPRPDDAQSSRPVPSIAEAANRIIQDEAHEAGGAAATSAGDGDAATQT